MKLDILIPTYNRARDLNKNLINICEAILLLKKEYLVRIILSDNASSDNTQEVIRSILGAYGGKIDFLTHRNQLNEGLLCNINKTLELARADYIMFIGDDDYIPFEYFEHVFSMLGTQSLGIVIPSRRMIFDFPSFEKVYHCPNISSKRYISSFFRRLYFSSKCNQLSGILYYNADLYRKWIATGSKNLYPFMFFAGISIQRKKEIFYVKGGEILITSTNKKDWGYGPDYLLGDIVENARLMTNSLIPRIISEILFAYFWRDRCAIPGVKGLRHVKSFNISIWNRRTLLLSTKMYISIQATILYVFLQLYRKTGRLLSPHI